MAGVGSFGARARTRKRARIICGLRRSSMTDGALRRVGILTAGGDCPGLNAVIRAFVKTASGHFEWEVLGVLDGFEGMFLPEGVRQLTDKDVSGILGHGGTVLGTSNRCNPFAMRALVNGEEQVTDRSAEVLARIKELG